MSNLSDNLQKEREIQTEIFACLDSFQSFIFNAGAGAGKTYSLIESIKFLLKTQSKLLRIRGQKISCITYTNTAVNEIKNRLGNSQLVEVSTIHEMLWEQIKGYKSLQLIDIHKNKLQQEVDVFLDEINEKKNDKNLSITFDGEWFQALLTDTAKNIFYEIENKNLASKDFRVQYILAFQEYSAQLSIAMRNLNDFKNFLKKHLKITSYENAISRINNPEERKTIKVEYDSNTNRDRLAYMRFSHDTLLEYSISLFEKYPILRQIIIDKYPYLFVDEYQDTNPFVISIIDLLYDQNIHNKSEGNNVSWLVGYFGDHKQHIYGDSGIGSKLLQKEKLQKKFTIIDKFFNRRSHQQIIDVINNVRAEKDFTQKALNPENNQGNITFFKLDEISKENEAERYVPEIIDRFRKTLQLENQPIDCLVALNKTIAELSGFGNILNEISNLDFIYWDNINTQFLSNDLSKLHPVILAIYHVVQFYCLMDSDNKTSTYADLLGNNLKSENIVVEVAEKFYYLFKPSADAKSLHDFINHISDAINSSDAVHLIKLIIQKHFSGIKEFKNNKSSFYDQYYNLLLELSRKEELDFSPLLNIPMTYWINWIKYINEVNNDVIYHTFHGTKGAEYENVIILMGNDFGAKQGKNKFKNYFIQLNDSALQDKDFNDTQNLLYVAFSRAIRNLWVIYTDPIDEIEDGIKSIFGENCLSSN